MATSFLHHPPPSSQQVCISPTIFLGERRTIVRKLENISLPLKLKRVQDVERMHNVGQTLSNIDQNCKNWDIYNSKLSNISARCCLHHEQRGLVNNNIIKELDHCDNENITKKAPFIDFLGVGRV
eukprot:c14763_g1_i2 orf=19-393(-)